MFCFLLPGLIAPGWGLAATKPGPAKAPAAQAPSVPKQAACGQPSSLIWAKREDYVAAHGEITEDLLIAATAQGAHNLVVATRNTNDFHAIQGITVEDWSKPLIS